MVQRESVLTPNAIRVLEMIAGGYTYEQILSCFPEMTYLDIFSAAAEALALGADVGRPAAPTLAQRRERHPRAYEKWTDVECDTLRELVRSGESVARIAGRLDRNRGAIRSRIVKLGIVNDLVPKEQARLRRIMERRGAVSDG